MYMLIILFKFFSLLIIKTVFILRYANKNIILFKVSLQHVKHTICMISRDILVLSIKILGGK